MAITQLSSQAFGILYLCKNLQATATSTCLLRKYLDGWAELLCQTCHCIVEYAAEYQAQDPHALIFCMYSSVLRLLWYFRCFVPHSHVGPMVGCNKHMDAT